MQYLPGQNPPTFQSRIDVFSEMNPKIREDMSKVAISRSEHVLMGFKEKRYKKETS